MNIDSYIKKIKAHPNFGNAGMILCHNGVVRQTPGDKDALESGKKVESLTLTVDHEKLTEIIERYKKTPGIIDILIEIAEGKPLFVGDDVMVLVVAGDVRTTVISVLTGALNEIKTTVTSKKECYIS